MYLTALDTYFQQAQKAAFDLERAHKQYFDEFDALNPKLPIPLSVFRRMLVSYNVMKEHKDDPEADWLESLREASRDDEDYGIPFEHVAREFVTYLELPIARKFGDDSDELPYPDGYADLTDEVWSLVEFKPIGTVVDIDGEELVIGFREDGDPANRRVWLFNQTVIDPTC